MAKEIILKGKNFTLRPYRKGDEFSIAENANNKKIANNLNDRFPSPYTLDDAKNWVRFNLKNQKRDNFIFKFVIDINGKSVGTIGLIDPNNKIPEIGYWLGEKYWGKGIMSEAVKLFTKYIFNRLKIQKVFAKTKVYNKGSQKVLKNAGFKAAGKTKGLYLKNGKFIDMLYFSKSK